MANGAYITTHVYDIDDNYKLFLLALSDGRKLYVMAEHGRVLFDTPLIDAITGKPTIIIRSVDTFEEV